MGATLNKFLGLRGTKLNVAIAIVAGVDLLLFGYDQGVMGGLLTLPSFALQFPQICTNSECVHGMSSHEAYQQSLHQGITIACYNLGCFLGAVIIMKLGNVLGRRHSILWGCSIMIVGAVLQCSAYTLPHFIIGRIITGIGNGFNTSTVPVWQSECSKPHRRGLAVVFEGSIVVAGVAISQWLDLGMSFTEPSAASWRFPIAFQLVFALFVIVGIYYMPESPRWLVLMERDDQAVAILSAIYDVDCDDSLVTEQIQAMRISVRESAASIRDVIRMGPKRNFHRAVLGYLTQVFQQIAGINIITYYAATIYLNQMGLSPLEARIVAAAGGTWYFLACIPGIFLVDRIGRRPLLLFGCVGMTLCLIVVGVTVYLGGTGPGAVAIVFIWLYLFCYSQGWNSIPWLYPAEIVPLDIRAQSAAISTSGNWIFNFMVVMVTPVCFAQIGWKTYIMFAAFNAAVLPVVYFCYPETAQRSLEEMDIIFSKSTGVLSAVEIAKNEPLHFDRHNRIVQSPADVEEAMGSGTSKDDKEVIAHHEVINSERSNTAPTN